MIVSKLLFALALATVIPRLLTHIDAVEVAEQQTMDQGAYLRGSGEDAGKNSMAISIHVHEDRALQSLGDWNFCSSSSQCTNGCCSRLHSDDGRLKCTPVGGFQASHCVAGGGGPAPTPTPPPPTPPVGGSGSLGDWAFCSSSSQCRNGCCSRLYSNDGRLKCTPVGGFQASHCVTGGGGGPAPTPARLPTTPTPPYPTYPDGTTCLPGKRFCTSDNLCHFIQHLKCLPPSTVIS